MSSDFELLQAWRAGDITAGQALVKRHYDAIYLFFYGKVDGPTSEDLTQATFETMCARRDAFRGESRLRTFVFGIARFKLIQHFERIRGNREKLDPLEDSVHDPALERSMTSLFGAMEREALLVRALRMLPLDDQILLELKDYEGLTAAELASVFEVPAGTVASRLRRARRRLRETTERLRARPELAEWTLTSLDSCMRAIRDRMAEVRR